MDFQGFLSDLNKPIIISGYGGTSQTISVPKSAKFVLAQLRAKGGNGGNGFTRAAGSAGGGGGGGGPGGANSLLYPANFFNGMIQIEIITTGQLNLSAQKNAAVLASVLPGAAGGNGTGAAVGALGSPGTASTSGIYPFESTQRTLQVATAGGAVAGGAGGTITATQFNTHTGGAGGGGCTTTNFAGGGIAFVSLGGTLVAGGTAGGGNGGDGVWFNQFNYGVGGSGGGSNNSAVGGSGGNGVVYGCGGGGGGAGLTGGAGGIGGPAAAFLYFI